MKVIDLLVKIAKGEEVPNKIKYDDVIWEYDGDYYSSKNNIILEEYCNLTTSLNDEVEIIEDTPKEDKKIEKLNIGLIADNELQGLVKSINVCNKEIQDKLNEVLDRLNR